MGGEANAPPAGFDPCRSTREVIHPGLPSLKAQYTRPVLPRTGGKESGYERGSVGLVPPTDPTPMLWDYTGLSCNITPEREIMAKNTELTAKLMAAVKKIEREEEVHVADVVRHEGPGILVPQDMELKDAVNILSRKLNEEEEDTQVMAVIPAFPYDGAHALKLALERLFGYVVSKRCMCGRNHNTDIKIVTDAQGTTVTVPWGEFEVPGITGHLGTGYTWEGKRVVFRIQGVIKGKDKRKFDALVDLTTRIATNESIYKGKAFSVKFRDEDGDTMPIPEVKFIDVSQARKPIYSAGLAEQFENDVMAYITHADLVRPLNGGSLKRGVLLDGPYGTGKTLASQWMAREGTSRGWTYVLVTQPEDYENAYQMAQAYQPSIVFCEDVDKIAGNDRDRQVDRLLNMLDGVNTKHNDILTVFTTNHSENITEAMYRPGRIDFRMRVTPPDAAAAIQIAIEYSQGRIDGDAEDFQEAASKLSGMIPPTIKEAVARAQVRAVVRTEDPNARISNADLVAAACAIEAERLVDRADQDRITKAATEIGAYAMRRMASEISDDRIIARNGR